MTTVPPPPLPPPPPPPCGNQALKTDSTPCPQHAAIPFNMDPPIQETHHSSETPHDAQGAESQPVSLEQHVTQLLPWHGQNICSGGPEKCPPVQETDPAPQALGATQMKVRQDEQDT